MAGRHETEAEKQFLADLEKAKALSLETLELEKIRKQRYSQPDPSAYSESRTLEEYKVYLQRKTQLHQGAATVSRNVILSGTAPPGAIPARLASEIHYSTARSQSVKGRDEADLISFNAPPPAPNLQDEAHNNLKELVDQMHRLNGQGPYDQNYKTQRSLSMSSASSYGTYAPAYVQQQAPQNFNPAAMQLVPYNQQAAKPKPLTPDELNRLYNMPIYGTAPVGPPTSGFIPQSQFPVNYSQFPAAYPPQIQPPSAPTSFIPQSVIATVTQPVAAGFIPQPSMYATSSKAPAAVVPVANPESALVHVPKLTISNRSASQPQQTFPPAIPGPSNARNSTGSSSATNSVANNTSEVVVLRPKSDPAKLGDNLIDLGFEDNSRVSVLEAFDPLLCGNRSCSGSSASDDDKGKAHARQM